MKTIEWHNHNNYIYRKNYSNGEITLNKNFEEKENIYRLIINKLGGQKQDGEIYELDEFSECEENIADFYID